MFEFIDRLLGLQFIDRAQKLRALENETAPSEIIALADARAVAKANKTVVCFSTEISITELSKLINGNKSGKPQAFKLLKVQFPSES